MAWHFENLRERLCYPGRERLPPDPPGALAAFTQLDTSKLMGLLGAIRVSIRAPVTCTIARRLQELCQSREHERIAPRKYRLVASSLLVIDPGTGLSLSIEAIPKLEVVTGLVDDTLVFRGAYGETVLDETVATHHHVDRAAEEPNEIDDSGMIVLAAPSHVKRPKDLTRSMECLKAEISRHVCEGIVSFTL